MTTEVVVINLNRFTDECQLCGGNDYLDFCVPFYEEPVYDRDIGEAAYDGQTVGGMSCCPRCWALYERKRAAFGGTA